MRIKPAMGLKRSFPNGIELNGVEYGVGGLSLR